MLVMFDDVMQNVSTEGEDGTHTDIYTHKACVCVTLNQH